MKLRTCCYLITVFLYTALAAAQTSPSPGSPMPASPSQLQPQLGQLDQTARQTLTDLDRMRVEKWKTDNNTKQQTRDNVDSLKKNLSSALPSLMHQVQSNPATVAAAVKLYRNLNAVYDVLTSVTESAGAFGSKDDYQALANDLSDLDNLRRSIADNLEQMASNQDQAYARLIAQTSAQQAAETATPPKKVIVDDTEPSKKTSKKKKTSAASAQSSSQPQ